MNKNREIESVLFATNENVDYNKKSIYNLLYSSVIKFIRIKETQYVTIRFYLVPMRNINFFLYIYMYVSDTKIAIF